MSNTIQCTASITFPEVSITARAARPAFPTLATLRAAYPHEASDYARKVAFVKAMHARNNPSGPPLDHATACERASGLRILAGGGLVEPTPKPTPEDLARMYPAEDAYFERCVRWVMDQAARDGQSLTDVQARERAFDVFGTR